jgi:Tfp pilus assembly protein PilF
MLNRLPLLLGICCLLTSLSGGCAAMRTWGKKSDEADVGKLREKRREEVVHDFERRRATAQLQAARERAEHGDPEAAEQILQSVISRDPTNVAAREQLAELYWAHEQLAEAEEQLREALALAPERAELHHLLGILLDARGNETEADSHLTRAVELEPANQLFRLTAESAGIKKLPHVAARPAVETASAVQPD